MFLLIKSQDIDDFDDGNTILLECENNDYIYISGFEIVKFKIEDKIIDYISLIGNNMVSFPIAVGEKYISTMLISLLYSCN